MMLSRLLRHKTMVSALLALGLTAAVDGGVGPPSRGLSPYVSAWMDFENRVFIAAEKKTQVEERLRKENMMGKIYKIISRFDTGLAADRHQMLAAMIYAESNKYGYDPLFITAVIVTESSFNNWAKSHRGALGLMQILPRTGRAMASEVALKWEGKLTLHDPEANIALGAYYLNKLSIRFGDRALALEAYNHGPSQLVRYLKKGIRPYQYSTKVMQNYTYIQSLLV